MFLDPSLRSEQSLEFESALRSKIVGQNEAVESIVDILQVFRAGMAPPHHPVGNFLFLGPTGVGKTRCVEAAAEILFNDVRAVTKIDCAEFQKSHEIAKIIGSPPGYLGHSQTTPLITQRDLSTYWTETLRLSFLLFDEIEKASYAMWDLLLGIMDKATLTLGDNSRVDLSQTVIFLTSNLGAKEISELMTGGMGFQQLERSSKDMESRVGKTAQEAAKRKFSPEFMNRLDRVVVFRPLRSDQLEEILEIELGFVQQRMLDNSRQVLLQVSQPARAFLLREGTDLKYGARHLKRAIEKHIVCPLSNLLATDQVHSGDVVKIDYSERLTFERDALVRKVND